MHVEETPVDLEWGGGGGFIRKLKELNRKILLQSVTMETVWC